MTFRERALAMIEEELRTPNLIALDKRLDELTTTAPTEAEREFLVDLRSRAKRCVSDTFPDSAVDGVVRAMLEELRWILLRGSADDVDR